MANKVKQFRFYNDAEARKGNASNNSPKTAEKAQFVDGTIFADCFPISQLGIQALPGTRFLLNNAPETDYILIGQTGIFELDLNNQTEITSIKFDAASMEKINKIANAVLIVDLIYDDGED